MVASMYGSFAHVLARARSILEPTGIQGLAPGLHMAPGVDDAFPSWMRLCSEMPVQLVLRNHRVLVPRVPEDRRTPVRVLFGVTIFSPWPQVRQDYPLNLSILLSGGKETNKDSPSSGERSGKSPT